MSLGNFLENALIKHITNQEIYNPPSKLYLALYTTNPDESDVGTEVIAPEYVRQEITFTAPVDGEVSNNTAILFPPSTSLWGDIQYVGIRDSISGGNLLMYGALGASSNIDVNDQAVFYIGDITFALD